MSFKQKYNYKNIQWNKNDIRGMKYHLKFLLDCMTRNNFEVSQYIKDKVKELHNDIINYETSVCSVCGDKQSKYSHMNVEHVTLDINWGFDSTHDDEHHTLTLCNKCYDIYIMNDKLGKFVNINMLL